VQRIKEMKPEKDAGAVGSGKIGPPRSPMYLPRSFAKPKTAGLPDRWVRFNHSQWIRVEPGGNSMIAWRWLGGLTMVVATAWGVTAYGEQAGEKPVMKAFDGPAFFQEMKTETTQTMKVQGMEVIQTQKQIFYVKWDNFKKDGSNWKVDYVITGVKMDIQIGGNQIAYDSTSPNPAPQNPLSDFFKALVGSKFTFTVDGKDSPKVTGVEGLDEFVRKLSNANPALQPLLQKILDKDALIQMTNPTFAAFPKTEEEFKKGTWTYPFVLNMGPIGTYDTTYTYTKDSKVPTKIDVSATMKYAPPKDKDSAGLPFVIKKGELTADKAVGSVTLDPTKGRVADSTMQMDLKGQLTIEIAGMETIVDLVQKQTSTLKTFDTDPLGTAKK
jgi:hypothetical protein